MDNVLKRVLVVDDEELMRNIICRFLSRLGSIVCTKAEDGQAAWEMLRQEDFDLVITDIRMPRMDGIALLEKIHEEMPQIPVIVITGQEEINVALAAIGKGAYSYIMKPFKLQEIAVNIEGAFRRKKGDD